MLSRRRLTRATLVALGAASLVVALSGNAMAKPHAIAKVQQVTQPLLVPADPPGGGNTGLADTTATCPGSTSIVGGGALFAPGAPLATTDIPLVRSGPLGSAWNIRYDNNNTSDQQTSAQALCLNKSLKVGGLEGKATAKSRIRAIDLQVQLAPQSSPTFGVAEFDVPCPGNSKVIGGGALLNSVSPGVAANMFESGAVGNSWHVRYDNDEPISQPATITALCIQNKLKVKGGGKATARPKIQSVSQALTLPPDEVGEATVACPAKTTVVSGGGLFPPGFPLNLGIEMFESGPQGNAWHVRYNSDVLTAPETVTVQANCLKTKLTVK
jgi:hypothetical protein